MILNLLPYPVIRLSLCVLMFQSSTTNAEMRALRITTENAAQLVQAGPDAIGGIGDWLISNGTLCAVISDIAHENEFSSRGGGLVDLGFCDRADDHYTTSQDLLDGQRTRPMDIDRIEIGSSGNAASIITFGSADGAEVETRYSLDDQHPNQLSISKRVRVTDENKPGFNFYSPFWFNYHSMDPFVFASRDNAFSRGFNNEDFVTRGSSAIREAALNADTIILSSPPDAEQAISYGWQLKSAKRISGEISYEVPTFVLADEESTVMLVLTDSFYLGDGSYIGLLQLPQLPLLSLDEDDYLQIEEVIYVGKNADVASITDQMLPDTPLVSGRVNEVDSALHIEFLDGTPFTFIRPAADGSFSFRAPAGEYRIRHRASASRAAERLFTVADLDLQIGTLSLPGAAKLNLPRNEAMRLVFVGLNGTPDPDFEDRLTDYSVHDDEGDQYRDRISQIFLAGIDSDQHQVELAAGSYRVYATRGPEYSLGVSDISVSQGKTIDLQIEPPRHTVPTPGYIAADLHVHTGLSFDNTFSTSARVRTFVAEHGEVMVSSEHDVLVDFAPFIDAMGGFRKDHLNCCDRNDQSVTF